jgi:hypothetical protein
MATLTSAAIEAGLARHYAREKAILAPSHGPRLAYSPKFKLTMEPNWASGEKEIAPFEEHPTYFEQTAEKIGVKPEFYVFSEPLKEWVRKNRYDRYVPEWLLKEWGLEVYDEDVNCTL